MVGEPSGDLHASKMMRAIRESDQEAEFRFFGGDRMVEVAGEESLALHYREASFMGFWQVLANLGTITKQIRLCKEDISDFAPDVVILVDYAGFNLRIAKYAHEQGIKVYYYIAPKVWAWKRGRVKKIAKYVDKLFVIFPFEVEFFSRYGIETYYDGNPIMDAIAESGLSPESTEQDKGSVVLVAGSRRAEVKSNLPFMVRVASEYPDFRFSVAAVPWIDMKLYRDIVGDASNIEIVVDKTYELLSRAEAAMVTSGTATLETALLGAPQVVCYWVSPLSTIVGKMLVKIKFISLVNIVMQREVVRELLYAERMTIENGVTELGALLEGGSKRERVLDDYRELRELMGTEGASSRTGARMVSQLLKDRKQ